MKTFNLKSADVTRKWVIIDASEAPLGRVAAAAAKHLIGKHKPTYTAHIDGGDAVIIINASKTIVTGALKKPLRSITATVAFPVV